MIALTNLRVGVEAGELVVRVELSDANRAALMALLQLPPAVTVRRGRGGDRRSLPDLPPIGSEERDAQDREIARRYVDELESIPDIAHALGCGATTIETALDRAGVMRRTTQEAMAAKWERRRRGLGGAPQRHHRGGQEVKRALTDEQAAEAKRLYVDELESTTVIAELFNANSATICNTLRRLGVTVRSRSEGQRIIQARQRASRPAPVPPPPKPKPVKPAAKAKPPAKPKAPPLAEHPQANEIVRLYVDEEASIHGIVEILDNALSAGQVQRILTARGVAMRSKAQAAKARSEQEAARREVAAAAKLPPLPVPRNAPRRKVKLEELRPVQRLDAPKKTHREAIAETKARTIKIARAKRTAQLRGPASPQELQDAVKRHFENGGEIIAIESPKIDQTARPNVGTRADGRR